MRARGASVAAVPGAFCVLRGSGVKSVFGFSGLGLGLGFYQGLGFKGFRLSGLGGLGGLGFRF